MVRSVKYTYVNTETPRTDGSMPALDPKTPSAIASHRIAFDARRYLAGVWRKFRKKTLRNHGEP